MNNLSPMGSIVTYPTSQTIQPITQPVVYVGMRTPWGKAQDVEQYIRGVYSVSAASHGGIKVCPKFNRWIPKDFRNASGWYEEDCESAIPLYFVLDEDELSQLYVPTTRQQLEATLKEWFWRAWESTYNVILAPKESRSKDGYVWHSLNADKWVSCSASMDGERVKVWFRLAGCTKAEQFVYMSQEEYDKRHLSPSHKLAFTQSELDNFGGN